MSTRPSRGVTLIELVVFIVIVGVAMAGLFAAFNTITAASADPQVRKQVLAIAESLMEEIALMPFTFCDPDDANAATAASSAGCAVAANSEDLAMGSEGADDRYITATPFDNVSDYHNFAMGANIRDIGNNIITDLDGYSVTSITVTQAGLGPGTDAVAADTIAAAEALRISITVTGPGGVSITLEGYRARYAPNAVP